jgi:hypothetical protein
MYAALSALIGEVLIMLHHLKVQKIDIVEVLQT